MDQESHFGYAAQDYFRAPYANFGFGALASLPLHRAPADIPAAEAVRPADFIDRRVGAFTGLANGVAHPGDVEHAPAVGHNTPVLGARPGMEDFHAFDGGGLIEAF